MPTTHEVAMRSGLSYRQLDYWLRSGFITIADDADGSGSRRRFTDDEVADVMKVAQMMRQAESVGLNPTGTTISHVWHALQTGREWNLRLTTEAM